jgi:hypothetical protein
MLRRARTQRPEVQELERVKGSLRHVHGLTTTGPLRKPKAYDGMGPSTAFCAADAVPPAP